MPNLHDDPIISVDDLRAIADLGRTREAQTTIEASVRGRLHREMQAEIDGRSTVRGRRSGFAAKAAVAAAGVAVVSAVALGTGGSGTVLSPAEAQAAPLLRLTRTLATAPAPTGDATLTIRHFVDNDGKAGQSYTLVKDGQFLNYFGVTPALLRTASPVSPTGRSDKATGPGTIAGSIAAAAQSSTLSPEQAARALDASSDFPHPAGYETAPIAQRANGIWLTALSVIEIAGGRPDVRAGALKALSTVGVTISRSSSGGRPTLRLTHHTDVPSQGSYEDVLEIDATTGTPIRALGGPTGKTPSVTTYEVSRVDAADYGH